MTCIRMIQRMAVRPIAFVDASAFAHGDVTESPMPVPKASKASDNADWVRAREVDPGATAVWRVTVTNNGGETLTDVTASDPRVPGCTGTLAASLR